MLHATDALEAAGVAARQLERLAQRAEQFFGDRRRATAVLLLHARDHGAEVQHAEQDRVVGHVAARDAIVERAEQAPEAVTVLVVGIRQEVGDDGHEALECADILQQLERADGVAAAQQPQDLFEHARGRGADEIAGGLLHRLERLGLDVETEATRELGRPQDAHRVLAEAHGRIADRADHAGFEVGQPVAPVEDLVLGRIEEQRVDREVAPQRVFFGRAELVVARDQQVVFAAVRLGRTAERADLEDLGVAIEVQVGELEPPADDPAVARERALDLLRPRGRRDVEVLGRAIEQQVTDAAADQVRLEAAAREALRRLHGVAVELAQVGPRGREYCRFYLRQSFERLGLTTVYPGLRQPQTVCRQICRPPSTVSTWPVT